MSSSSSPTTSTGNNNKVPSRDVTTTTHLVPHSAAAAAAASALHQQHGKLINWFSDSAKKSGTSTQPSLAKSELRTKGRHKYAVILCGVGVGLSSAEVFLRNNKICGVGNSFVQFALLIYHKKLYNLEYCLVANKIKNLSHVIYNTVWHIALPTKRIFSYAHKNVSKKTNIYRSTINSDAFVLMVIFKVNSITKGECSNYWNFITPFPIQKKLFVVIWIILKHLNW